MKADEQNIQNHFLSFYLGKEKYALHVSQVREILELPDITRVPLMPETIRGVFNLRGNVVPVFSLKRKFEINESIKTDENNILVCESLLGAETLTLGILADSVEEVIRLNEDEIEPPPRMENETKHNYISGMGKADDNFVIILDINNIIDEEELKLAVKEKTGA